MKWTITIMDSSAGRGEGTIEVTGDRFEVRKKSALVRAAFGVIGSALTSGKEIMSFSQQDIEIIHTKRDRSSKTETLPPCSSFTRNYRT